MVMSLSKQLEQLEKQIIDKMGQHGLEEVYNKVAKKGREKVQEQVYDVYPDPIQYDRTELLLTEWKPNYVSPLTIGIFSDRWDGGTYVSEVVETGKGYTYTGYGLPYEQPRPFFAKTVQEVKDERIHVFSYAKAMRDAGLPVRVKRKR